LREKIGRWGKRNVELGVVGGVTRNIARGMRVLATAMAVVQYSHAARIARDAYVDKYARPTIGNAGRAASIDDVR
jgi:hypothetical protein